MYRQRFNNNNSSRRVLKTFNPYFLVGQSNSAQIAAPQPQVITHKFSDFQINDALRNNVLARGYTVPTPIQDQAIPQLLLGRDLIGIANTGTGKTAAFLIPLIDKVLKDKNQKVLIVAPTRELAVQIRDELVAFAKGLNIYSTLCIGGTNMRRQKDDLHRFVNFIIGTPGRLKDLINTRNLDLTHFQSVVLDEADHMVDIGFIQDVKYIVSHLATQRQSLFFSATINAKVREILQAFVRNPVTVSVKTENTSASIAQTIIKVVDRTRKIDQLHDLLIQKDFEKVLIFGRTKHGVQKLADELVKRGFRADAIHGNKKQAQRQRILQNFKNNNIKILLATDVAARGLDIPNVSHVINYELPESQDAYTHRIGRTGRADKRGIALTFVE